MTGAIVNIGNLRLAIMAAAFLLGRDPVEASASAHRPYSEAQSDDAEMHFEHGLQFARAGELQAAEQELRAAVKLRASDPEYLSSLATVLAIEKKVEESTILFEKALKIRPGDSRSRRDLSANLWQLKRYAEAKRHLKMVLQGNPADQQAKLLLGLVSEKTGDDASAITMLESIPDVVSTQPEALVALAKSYYRTGQGMKASGALGVLTSGPGGYERLLWAAQVAEESGDYATAERLLLAIPAESSDSEKARYRLAVVKFNTGRYQQSQKIIQELVRRGRKDGPLLRLSAWCYHKTNQDEQAINTFREAVELDPTDEKNFLDLGALLLEQRKFSAARELANRTVVAFPKSAHALALLASVELARENFTDAVQAYSRSLELDPDNSDAIVGLAKAQAAAGMNEQAGETLEKALQRSPGKSIFELQLALLLLNEAANRDPLRQARAERLLHSAAKHDPNSAEAQYQLGNLALSRGQTQSAIAYLENAARMSSESAKAHFALARAYRRVGRTEDAARETALYERFKQQSNSEPKNSPENLHPGE
jgi:tetratricopeptide (TPR) repeat protein